MHVGLCEEKNLKKKKLNTTGEMIMHGWKHAFHEVFYALKLQQISQDRLNEIKRLAKILKLQKLAVL